MFNNLNKMENLWLKKLSFIHVEKPLDTSFSKSYMSPTDISVSVKLDDPQTDP